MYQLNLNRFFYLNWSIRNRGVHLSPVTILNWLKAIQNNKQPLNNTDRSNALKGFIFCYDKVSAIEHNSVRWRHKNLSIHVWHFGSKQIRSWLKKIVKVKKNGQICHSIILVKVSYCFLMLFSFKMSHWEVLSDFQSLHYRDWGNFQLLNG